MRSAPLRRLAVGPVPLVHNGRPYLYTGHDEDGFSYLGGIDYIQLTGAEFGTSGFGGDEVARVRRPEGGVIAPPTAPDRCGERVRDLRGEINTGIAPPTVVPETALIAREVATPLLARRSLWIVAPFTGA